VRDDLEDAAADLFEALLRRTHLSTPSDVADVIVEEAQRVLGATDVVVYWLNRERTTLMPLFSRASPERSGQDVEGSLIGRAFASTHLLSVPASAGRRRVYVPVLDGTDRIGALELEVPVGHADALPPRWATVLERFGHAVAILLMAKKPYGDSLELVQRTRPMEIGAEMLWSVLPPLTYATDGLVIAAMLEPTYDNGGDSFDYAVNDDVTHLAVFDGVGHGLAAAGMSTFAVAAYRHSRRNGLGLVESYTEMDEAIAATFGEGAFVTGVLARLDPRTGMLSWVNAGHPPPMLLRDGRVVKVLDAPPATPLGMQMFDTKPAVAQEHLQPGDTVVFYTDGVVEARRPGGGLVGVEGLTDFLEREAAAQQSPPETLRRLQHALLAREQTVLGDDATALLVEWRGGSERKLLPQTV
jgi:hypothetical protein